MIPFTIGMTRQQYSVYQVHKQKGRHLSEIKGTFLVETTYLDPKLDLVMLQGYADSGETIYDVGHWVGMMHMMYQNSMGENYKLAVLYTENEN